MEPLSEEQKIFAGVLKALLRRETSELVEALADGRISHAAVERELVSACVRAGSAASRLLGPAALTRLLLAICPPRERTLVEDLAADMACVLQVRRERRGQALWDGEPLRRELLTLFEEQAELCLRAAEYVRRAPALDDDAVSEPLCLALEQALRARRAELAH